MTDRLYTTKCLCLFTFSHTIHLQTYIDTLTPLPPILLRHLLKTKKFTRVANLIQNKTHFTWYKILASLHYTNWNRERKREVFFLSFFFTSSSTSTSSSPPNRKRRENKKTSDTSKKKLFSSFLLNLKQQDTHGMRFTFSICLKFRMWRALIESVIKK